MACLVGQNLAEFKERVARQLARQNEVAALAASRADACAGDMELSQLEFVGSQTAAPRTEDDQPDPEL